MFSHLITLTRRQKRVALLANDAIWCGPALILAIWLRGESGLAFEQIATLFAPLAAATMLGSHVMRIADTRISAYEERAVAKSFLLSVGLGAVLILCGGILGYQMHPALAVLFAGVHFALSVVSRVAMAQLLILAYRRGEDRRRILIYGAGMNGMQALRALKTHPRLVPVGFVDDNPALHGLIIGGLRVHPPLRLARLAMRLRAEEVLIAKPSLGPADRARLGAHFEVLGLSVTRLPGFSHLAGPDSPGCRDLTALTRAAPERSAAARQFYAGKQVMITGAGGSIGSELAEQVLSLRPSRLVLLEQNEHALFRVDQALRPIAEAGSIPLTAVLGSVGDRRLLGQVLDRHPAEIVLHAAAHKHVPLVEANPAVALENNVLGTDTLARACADHGVARFVLISTDKAVRPAGTMGASKWIAEQIVREIGQRVAGLDTTVVRFGNVLGSSGSVLPIFEEQVRQGGPVRITDRNMERYFMSVDEAVHLVLEAGAMDPAEGVLLFDMGSPVRIDQLARQVIEAFGYSVRDADRPDGDIAICETGARPGEKLRETLSATDLRLPTGHPRIFACPEHCLSEIEVAQLLKRVRDAVAQGRGLDVETIARLGQGPLPAVQVS